MNENYIIQKIKPYLNDQGMLGEEDFDRIFSMLNRRQQYKVIDILIAHNIEIDYENRSISKKSKFEENPNFANKVNLNKLTNEQLCVMYQKGYRQALDALIIKNENLVWSRVKIHGRSFRHKLDDDDLFQYGVIGMMIAAKKFDTIKESKFTTYAIWWIDQQILRSIADYGFTIRLPVHAFDSLIKIMRVFRENPDCSKDQIYEKVKEYGFSRSKFESLLNIAHNILSITSLNTYVGEDEDSELSNFVKDDISQSIEEQIEQKELKHIVKELLNTITPKEQKVLKLRYGIEDNRQRTLEEVGKEFNVTRERIRQIEARALRKLRHPSRSKLLKDFV
ncbi:MAG TPA: sigma-70 family RNA polymerase sigma factor [Clostridiales bacterium]|nr:sigma-70 family RNA polymerase sigma factor [Clostridiales bacterium]